MNIFALCLNVQLCAKYHCDRHVVKMILESAQLLCGVYIHTTPGIEVPYKLTHKNHPCAIWARKSLENYFWLLKLADALCLEYTHRYGKTHKTQRVIEYLSSIDPPAIPSLGLTPHATAMPNEYRCQDPVRAYKNYYMQEKRHLFAWKKRGMPDLLKFPFLDDIKKRRVDHSIESSGSKKRKC